MKSLRMIAAITLTIASVTTPIAPAAGAPANPPGQNGQNAELLQFCSDLLASGEFSDALTFGRCMAFNTNSDQGFVASFCQFLRGEGLLEDEGFTSYADCVTKMR